ncbi:hypothetical protein C7S20_16050 [Christiangramia fulva]|uniref:Uncharacterized protein n=1 Tax=Christiangramia fulva TaxID=2126553 RepID=A0A2R3Z8R0_9FLAO|nr:hypothetical protein [Christiangramia fulva]AVR46655.1 hypothetical protein C7S20_16050 [Christiangramia fulva]
MESGKIEKLIEKYEEGQTSLAEENILREYFKNEVPAHLSPYKLMFAFAEKQRENKMEEKAPQVGQKSYRFTWASVAAVLIIALGVFFFFQNSSSSLNQNDLGTITDEELALQKTKETLQMVSQIMNEGSADLVYLKEFNKTTNKIIKID